MKTLWLLGLSLGVLMTSAYGQLVVKNNSFELMTVNNTGDVVIGTAGQSGTLTVLGSTTTATLKITDGAASGRVLKSDADGNASWGIDLVNDADADPINEKPQGGTAISVSDRVVNVNVDNNTIKVNGSDQLYVDALPASAGWTFYNAQEMLIECGGGSCTSNMFFKWYSRSELGIPATAQAVYLHIALSNEPDAHYNLTVSEESWSDNNTAMASAITNGAFLTATIKDSKPGVNAGIVKLNSNGLWVGLRYLGDNGPPTFVRIKVMGYLQ